MTLTMRFVMADVDMEQDDLGWAVVEREQPDEIAAIVAQVLALSNAAGTGATITIHDGRRWPGQPIPDTADAERVGREWVANDGMAPMTSAEIHANALLTAEAASAAEPGPDLSDPEWEPWRVTIDPDADDGYIVTCDVSGCSWARLVAGFTAAASVGRRHASDTHLWPRNRLDTSVDTRWAEHS